MNKNKYIAIAGLAALGVAFLFGRGFDSADEEPQAEQPVTANAQSNPHAPDAAGANPHASGGGAAGSEVGDLRKSVRFPVGDVNVKSIYVDGPITWIGTSNGLIRFDSRNGETFTFGNRNGLLSNGIFYVGKIKGELWVGTYGGGLSVLNFESQEWRNYNIPDGMGDAFIYDVEEMANGDIWLATWSGANRIIGGDMDSDKAWELYTVENTSGGLPNDWVYGLAEGKDGEVWMATEGGLARFVENKWDNWQHKDGLGAPFELVEANMPYKSDPGEASSHHARQKVEMGLEDINVAYNPNYIIALEVDNDGLVWAGTWGAGLSTFDGETWKTLTVTDGLPGNHIFSLGKDNQGRIWAGSSQGLGILDQGKIRSVGHEDGLYSPTIFSMAFSDKGAAWVGAFGDITWFPRGIE